MKKIYLIFVMSMVMFGCSKHDPILPGVRHEIFASGDVVATGEIVPDLAKSPKDIYFMNADCNCSQDKTNTVFCGNKKMYIGFAGETVVNSGQKPICVGNYLYTGLSSGTVIKINKTNRKLVWATDVYKESSFTGGASVVDIIARVGFDNGFVYAGGLGDAFCKLNAENGNKIWCLNISVPVDFMIVDNFAFVVGSDSILYAINIKDGVVYWKTPIKKQIAPKYDGEYIIVGKQKIDYKNGALI